MSRKERQVGRATTARRARQEAVEGTAVASLDLQHRVIDQVRNVGVDLQLVDH
jgi:hypothetical protein